MWELEGIRIVIRAPRNARVLEYDYERRAADNQRISELLTGRIEELIGEYEVGIIDGKGGLARRNSRIDTVHGNYRVNEWVEILHAHGIPMNLLLMFLRQLIGTKLAVYTSSLVWS